ncbi:MAG UNVERIFIED_CONTAM: hypothetical protein LVT10_04030 [Anaerolineae bacterium]|jgi:hypothetical protein
MGRTKQRARQRKKEKQQRRNRYILIGVVGLAALVAVAVILQNRPIQIEIPEDLLTRYDNIPNRSVIAVSLSWGMKMLWRKWLNTPVSIVHIAASFMRMSLHRW